VRGHSARFARHARMPIEKASPVEVSRNPKRAKLRRATRSEQAFSLGAGASPRTLLAHLRREFTLRPQPRQSSQLTWLDTFDWRIHSTGMRLYVCEEDDSSLLTLESVTGRRHESMVMEKSPAFASGLPEGRLRRRLESLTRGRRLMPLAQAELTTRCHIVLDDEEKTVARIFFDTCRVRDPEATGASIELPVILRVGRVEGYAADQARVLECLRQRRGLEHVEEDLAERALRALGRVPTQRLGGLDVELDPSGAAGAAFLSLQRGLFHAMRSNEPGIRKDLDTEHLHDLRVAVRRSRVLHRLFREEIRGSEFDRLTKGFKWLARVTGPTRDLDVQLHELDAQLRDLPEESNALLPLVSILRERRRQAWEALVTALDSDSYAELVETAADLLDRPDHPTSRRLASAGPLLGSWAAHRIARAHRRLLRHGREIHPGSPDANIHALRIEGKRMRYLLEFFRSLHPADETESLLKEFRRLQDNLGDFNDACVRIEMLRSLARDLDESGHAASGTLLAVGRLIERSEQRKAQERLRFEERFARFEARGTRARFRQLFGSGRRHEAPAASAHAKSAEEKVEERHANEEGSQP